MADRLRIGVDMDDVICDTYGALVAWCGAQFGLAPEVFEGRPIRAPLSAEQARRMQDMLDEGSIFRALAPKAGAAAVLARLSAHHDVFIVTAAMEHPASMAHKFAWIREHLPFWDPLKIVFCGEKYVADVDVLIDDSPHHFERLRGRGLVFSAAKNAGETRYPRVNDWAEVADFFGV